MLTWWGGERGSNFMTGLFKCWFDRFTVSLTINCLKVVL